MSDSIPTMDGTLLSTQFGKLSTSFNALNDKVCLGRFVFVDKWDVEAAEVLTEVNDADQTNLKFHTTAECLVLDIKVVEIDAKRTIFFEVWNAEAEWWRILGYRNSISANRS